MLNATFRQLEVFMAVVEAGSFARAAETLNISQPGISRHIKALEDQAGGPLLLRKTGHRSELTALGEIVHRHAPNLLRELEEMRQALRTEREARRHQRVRITGFPYVIEHLIRPLLPDFLSAYPRAAIEVLPVNRDLVERRRNIIVADLGFILTMAEEEPDLDMLCALECGLVVSAGHPLAKSQAVTSEMLEATSFILPLPDSRFSASVLDVLHALGCWNITVSAHAQQIEVIKDLVERGRGVAHMPLGLIGKEIAAGSIVRLPIAVPTMQVGVMVTDAAARNPMARKFADFVRRKLGETHLRPPTPLPAQNFAPSRMP